MEESGEEGSYSKYNLCKISKLSVSKIHGGVCGCGCVYVNKAMFLKALNNIRTFCMILWLPSAHFCVSHYGMEERKLGWNSFLCLNKYLSIAFS